MARTIPQVDLSPNLDLPALLKRLNGSRDHAIRLLHSFCQAHAQAPDEIVVALAAGDLVRAHHIAHMVSGSAANLGLSALAAEAHQLEDSVLAARAGGPAPPKDNVHRLATRFAEAVAEVRETLPLPPPEMAVGDQDRAAAFHRVDSQLAAQDCEVFERLPTLLPLLPEEGRSAFVDAVHGMDFARGRAILREFAAHLEIPLD